MLKCHNQPFIPTCTNVTRMKYWGTGDVTVVDSKLEWIQSQDTLHLKQTVEVACLGVSSGRLLWKVSLPTPHLEDTRSRLQRTWLKLHWNCNRGHGSRTKMHGVNLACHVWRCDVKVVTCKNCWIRTPPLSRETRKCNLHFWLSWNKSKLSTTFLHTGLNWSYHYSCFHTCTTTLNFETIFWVHISLTGH